MATSISALPLLFTSFIILSNAASYNVNVINFGAKTDGVTDSTQAFMRSWEAACGSATAATVVVPKGEYMVKALTFRGPCKSRITFRIYGTIVAPTDYRDLGNSEYWILFIKVSRVALVGGSFDARGAGFWACRRSGHACPAGARSITFNWANDVRISGVKSINSQITHLVINSCTNVAIDNVKLMAPGDSPNTDGFHVQLSTGVTITSSTVQTGDDCVAIGAGTRNLYMSKIGCGPGHGVSIGSLAKELNEEGVQNITLTNSVFSGSKNGVRIKSWAKPSNGFVRNVLFQNLVMRNVQNPIIIDQDYCPSRQACPSQSSGVKISQVTYKNIKGTSATEKAMTFICSPRNECTGITLQDIKLTFNNRAAVSLCKNIAGTSVGEIVPNSCLRS